jgi:hypothetical protein
MLINVCWGKPEVRGRSSSSVWMEDLMVSAGKSATLYATPAQAPEKADSHACSSVSLRLPLIEGELRKEMRTDATNSLEVNQAAVPPVSRMRVPV